MTRFLAFAYTNGRAAGGFGDLTGPANGFATLSEAKEKVERRALDFRYRSTCNGHVVEIDGDDVTLISIFECKFEGTIHSAKIKSKVWQDI